MRNLNNLKRRHSVLLPHPARCAKIFVCEDENAERLKLLLEKSLKANTAELLPAGIILIIIRARIYQDKIRFCAGR